jgi:hypothetical protein
MYWYVKSSTGALAYDTPSVAVHAAGCEALCARLRGSGSGIAGPR